MSPLEEIERLIRLVIEGRETLDTTDAEHFELEDLMKLTSEAGKLIKSCEKVASIIEDNE